MDFRQIILSILLGFSMLLVSFAQAQTSRQVSNAPVLPLVRGNISTLNAPLLSSDKVMSEVAYALAPYATNLSFVEKFEILESADPFYLLEVAAEKYVLSVYDQAIDEKDTGKIIGALAYMTGLASPLYAVEVTAHNRLPTLFPRGDIAEETYTIAYKVHRGFMKWCKTTVLVSRSSQELLDINFGGCEHYIHQEDPLPSE